MSVSVEKEERKALGALTVQFKVVAYDESGYGDNRTRDFSNGNEAVDYAKSLDPRFGAEVWKTVTMAPINEKIWPAPSRSNIYRDDTDGTHEFYENAGYVCTSDGMHVEQEGVYYRMLPPPLGKRTLIVSPIGKIIGEQG